MILAFMEEGRSQGSWQIIRGARARFTEASDWAATSYAAATQGIAERANHMSDLTTQAVEATSAKLHKSSDSVASFVANTVQPARYGFVSGWLDQHPVIHWVVDHPLGAAALLVLGMFLLTGLFRAIAHTAEQLWIAVLRLPVGLGRWGWRLASGGIKPAVAPPPVLAGAKEQHRERLVYVLHRLEAIKQEQDRLLKELQELLE